MKIFLGSDHAGYELKSYLIQELEKLGYNLIDKGPGTSESVDYPDFAHPVANEVESNSISLGLLICGSGNGISMSANKHQGIRSAIAWNKEVAALARQHNDANILSLPARFVEKEEALTIVRAFLEAEFEGGRHQRRVSKISI
ncbi:MAG TPA: ribose 5-phosphate isomerase B [Flavobacteriales bacterium]|nr:ribose 5-phosphate isomerase B [Flavobacteriales bacterium]